MGCQRMSYVTVMTEFINKVTLFEWITQAKRSGWSPSAACLLKTATGILPKEMLKSYAHVIFKFISNGAEMNY